MTDHRVGVPVVTYGEPDVERTRSLHRSWSGHQRRLVVAATYNRHRLDQLAIQVLDALGKDVTLTTGKIGGEHGITLSAAWLVAVGVTDVLLTGADRLPVDIMRRWVQWLSAIGVRSWLLFATTNPRRPEPRLVEAFDVLADEWGAERQPESRLLRNWPTTPTGPPLPAAAQAEGTDPLVPRIQGPLFLPVCKQILPPEAFADIEQRFCDLVDELRNEIGSIAGKNANDRVCAVVRRHLDGTRSTNEGVLVAVAAQVAALVPAGWFISVNMQRLTSALEVLPRSGRADAERWWERLLAYRDPLVGTVAALYMADIDIVDQIALAIGDVSIHDDGTASVRRPSGGAVTFPVEQSIFLGAQLAFRQIGGASSDDRFLRTQMADLASRRHLRTVLHIPRAELGVCPSSVPVRNERATNAVLLDSYGISITKLERRTRIYDRQDKAQGSS